MLTNGDAVGLSNMASSSSVNGSSGMTEVRSGMSSKMITGKPMAAVVYRRNIDSTRLYFEKGKDVPIVCTIAKVTPNPTSCRAMNSTIRDLRTLSRGSFAGVKCRSRKRKRIFIVTPFPCKASAPINQLQGITQSPISIIEM